MASRVTVVPSIAPALDPASLAECLIPLLRRQADDLSAYLEMVACDVSITKTNTHAHCHFVALDGNKRPRVNDFAKCVAEKIVDYAIPRSEINRAMKEAQTLNSTAPITRLNTKARNLFTSQPKSGEGGEVLLYILTEHFLKFPQIFTKMVLKTSTDMHVHGSDGIHATVNKINGNLALYWGESKLHQDAASGIRECFASLAPFLRDAGGSRTSQDRDLQLMRDGLDIDDSDLEEALKRYLNPNDNLFKQLEYRGVCLVGFDSAAYPTTPNSMETQVLRTEVEKTFEQCKKQISKRVMEEKLHTFQIEIFCLPFPRVEDFRQAFRAELGLPNE